MQQSEKKMGDVELVVICDLQLIILEMFFKTDVCCLKNEIKTG